MVKWIIQRVLVSFLIVFLCVKIIDIYQRGFSLDKFIAEDTVAQNNDESQANTTNQQTDNTEQGQNNNSTEGQKLISSDKLPENLSIEQIKSFTETEIEVLQKLAQRRDRLIQWEKDLLNKERVLSLTEQKIDSKIIELRELKSMVDKALQEFYTEEDKKTQSLVKIYENMKSKNAADILSKMSLEDSYTIIGKMKEKNAAEILAKMDPRIAKLITEKLTEVGRLER